MERDFLVDFLGVRTYWEWDCTIMNLPYGDYYKVFSYPNLYIYLILADPFRTVCPRYDFEVLCISQDLMDSMIVGALTSHPLR